MACSPVESEQSSVVPKYELVSDFCRFLSLSLCFSVLFTACPHFTSIWPCHGFLRFHTAWKVVLGIMGMRKGEVKGLRQMACTF